MSTLSAPIPRSTKEFRENFTWIGLKKLSDEQRRIIWLLLHREIQQLFENDPNYTCSWRNSIDRSEKCGKITIVPEDYWDYSEIEDFHCSFHAAVDDFLCPEHWNQVEQEFKTYTS